MAQSLNFQHPKKIPFPKKSIYLQIALSLNRISTLKVFRSICSPNLLALTTADWTSVIPISLFIPKETNKNQSFAIFSKCGRNLLLNWISCNLYVTFFRKINFTYLLVSGCVKLSMEISHKKLFIRWQICNAWMWESKFCKRSLRFEGKQFFFLWNSQKYIRDELLNRECMEVTDGSKSFIRQFSAESSAINRIFP